MIKSFGLIAVGVSSVAILVPGALAGTPSSSGFDRADEHFVAHAAHTLSITDTAAMHYTGGSGSLLHESGAVAGTLPGSMRADCKIAATLSTNFTIYATGGTIKGHGTATPHGSGAIESFAGTLVATGGTGRYAHAHGRGGLYGTFNRKSYALTVQTTGKLAY